jgi:hypothetical protein
MANNKDTAIWFKILDSARNLPGATVDREVFLQKQYEKYCDQSSMGKILNEGPMKAGLDLTLMDKIAADLILGRSGTVTAISTAAGLPGGFAMAATIPADLIQFYWHVIVAAQELAYIYGFPSLSENEENFNSVLTVLIGVMAGIGEAVETINEVMGEQLKNKMGKIALGKILDKTVTRIAVIISLRINKKTFFLAVFKATPLIGGLISGSVTLFSFNPMCNRLKGKLHGGVEILKKGIVTG